MKKLLVGYISLACALALTANAAPGKKDRQLTDEQKTVKKATLEKYDTNKDGKLDKEERSKMTKDDKKRWNQAFGQKKKKDKQ